MFNELDDSVLERGRRVIAALIVEPLMYVFSASLCCDVAKWMQEYHRRSVLAGLGLRTNNGTAPFRIMTSPKRLEEAGRSNGRGSR
jgi:hypothetical protein